MKRHIRRRTVAFIALLITACAAVAVPLTLHAVQREATSSAVSSSHTSVSSASVPVPETGGKSSGQASSGGSVQMQGGSSVSLPAAGSLLMLVNKSHPLPADYVPDFATVDIAYYYSAQKDNRFDARAARYLDSMVADSRKEGANLVIVSGYRSPAYQQQNFRDDVNSLIKQGYTSSQAESITATTVAPPGTSEHETGLAVDVVTYGWFVKNTDLNETFDQTPAFRWLSDHAADYGFILRYPKGKESITGYSYEPWHYRFVGLDKAKTIRDSGLCLEEYLNRYGG